MPSWLILSLFVLGCIGVTALLAGGAAGSWRGALTAAWQFGLYLLILAAPGLVAWLAFTVWPPVP